MKKNSKGFTLIELLAVIIILGILMIIAIPSVTEYISDSRKESYIVTVKEVVNGVALKVNSSEYPFFDKNTTYYVPFQCIETENENTSPFGKWKDTYVLVNYTGEGYDYYFTGYDEVGFGTTEIIPIEKLNKDLINPEQNNLNNKRGIERDNVAIIDKNTCSAKNIDPEVALGKVNSDGTEMVLGLLKDKAQMGDFVMYDAGTWTETKPMPIETFDTFGGYTSGQSRNSSVNCYSSTNRYSGGWRVLGIDGDNVVLVHAGTPECFYSSCYYPSGITTLKNHDWNVYLNPEFAVSSQSIDIETVHKLVFSDEGYFGYDSSYGFGKTEVLVGNYVYADVVSDFPGVMCRGSSRFLYSSDSIIHYSCFYNDYMAVRPIVKLKRGVLTSGKGVDAYGNEAWRIEM